MESEQREELADGQLFGRFGAGLRGSLEQKFINETDAERDRQIAFWIGCGLCFNWLMFAVDLLTIPEVWKLALLLRICVGTPVSLVAIWILTRPGPRWQRSMAAIAAPSVMMLKIVVLFGLSAHPDMLRSVLALSIGVLWNNVIVPMRLRDTLVFTVVTMVGCDLINMVTATLHNLPFTYPDLIIPTHGLVALSILSRLLAERQSRRSFVLGLRLQIQADDLARSNTQLLKMSNTDPLTGLANRRSFDLALAQAHQDAAAANSAMAVMMIDVDFFKLFNDTAGHLEGDRCLTVVARTIAEQVRSARDVAARFGGEEFVVLMPGATLVEAQEIATRIHTAISAMRVFHPARAGSGFVSVSIGVAGTQGGPSMPTAAALVATADEALYAAKKAGRDQVRCMGEQPVFVAAGQGHHVADAFYGK